jgi:hypothetical protein
LPTTHGLQEYLFATSSSFLCLPTAHAEQAILAASRTVPGSQMLHSVEVYSIPVTLSMGQMVQEVDFEFDEYEPRPHCVHVTLEPALCCPNFPLGQSAHATMPFALRALCSPAPHTIVGTSTQVALLKSGICGGLHTSHVSRCSCATSPTAQALHDAAILLDLYLPY